MENSPDLWRNDLQFRHNDGHKYNYGSAIIYGAPELTGATRLAAESCARMGTGLVTVLAPKDTGDIYRASLPAHILVRDDVKYTDDKITAKLYGPGGLGVKIDFQSDIPTILDADALTNLPEHLPEHFILTPHEGEFDRTFPDIKGHTKVERAQNAAQKTGCHIVLKGGQTVIAAPNEETAVNTHASPWLATAGTGDVLAGMITGLVAQGLPIFKACCAAVWIHGECGLRAEPYLVASDLETHIKPVLEKIMA